MSIVKINAITVPDGSGNELLSRFEARVGEVENMEGFESFELLRPASGNTWYVYTRWASEEALWLGCAHQLLLVGMPRPRRNLLLTAQSYLNSMSCCKLKPRHKSGDACS